MKDDDEAFIFRWFRTTNYFCRAEPRVSLVTPRKPLHLVNVTARRLFNDKMRPAVGLLVQKAARLTVALQLGQRDARAQRAPRAGNYCFSVWLL